MSTKAFWRNGRLYFWDTENVGEITPADGTNFIHEDSFGITTTTLVGITGAEGSGFFGTDPGTGDTVTVTTVANVGGCAELLSGTADDDHCFLSMMELSHEGRLDACFETRVQPVPAGAITDMYFAAGFTDATGIAVAGAMTEAAGAWTTASVDGAALVFDSDATLDVIWGMSVLNSVDYATPTNTGILPVKSQWYVLRVELEDNGTTTAARMFVDGVQVAYHPNALTRTTQLTPFVSCGTRTIATANILNVDYVKVWQRR